MVIAAFAAMPHSVGGSGWAALYL